MQEIGLGQHMPENNPLTTYLHGDQAAGTATEVKDRGA